MLAFVLLFILLMSILVTCASLVRLLRTNTATLADAGLFTAPFLLWLMLAILGWRQKSLSNLVEPLALFALLSVCIGMRVFMLRQGTNLQRSLWSLSFGLAAALLVYAFVPVLPE